MSLSQPGPVRAGTVGMPAPRHAGPLEGSDQAHVVTTWDALRGAGDDAAHVVVIDGTAITTAPMSSNTCAREVCARRRHARIGVRPRVDDHDRPDLLRVLRDRPVEIVVSAIVESIGADNVVLRDAYRGGVEGDRRRRPRRVVDRSRSRRRSVDALRDRGIDASRSAIASTPRVSSTRSTKDTARARRVS
jgi:hypothetical protein